jgi:WD40 repeat protein
VQPDRLTAALADRYRIERELGQGGMATVYLAQDVRHARKVALKILRPELAAVIGADRFLAEITTTANLQHPHILPLHDSGEAGGSVFYVMPYVEGESLRDRLNREKQLPVADAVRLTREVAAALDYAHRHGVIHRDIKPENILLHDGSALVADFGIALAVSRSEGGSRMTETGMSLGTPHYMSPEQAMGERELTPRSDVYALGCVLYEMLVGEPPFTGPTPQAIVAKVITEKPPLATAARESVPRHIARAIQKSLAKLPADRFGSAAELADALVRPGWVDEDETDAATPSRGTSRKAIAGLGVLALALAAVAAWGWLRPRPESPVAFSYFKVAPAESPPRGPFDGTLAPDGTAIVYVGPVEQGTQRLWIKRRNELHASMLPGTEGAGAPFFSGDSRWVAFFAGGKLKKVPSSGGGVVVLADAATPYLWGGWLDDGRIVYAGPGFTLQMVSDAGGTPETVVDKDVVAGRGAVGAVPLPESRGVLFAQCGINCATSDLWVLDLETRKSKQLLPNVLVATYLPTGHLLYSPGNGTMVAAPFDLGSLTLRGPGVPVLEGLARFAGFAVARNGTVIYQEGDAGTVGRPVWVTRDGRATVIDSAWNSDVSSLALSPDGRRLAVAVAGGKGSDLWIKELDRGPLSKLTFGEEASARPAWTPDGRSVIYISGDNLEGQVRKKRVDGTGQAEVIGKVGNNVWSEALFSPDGRWLILRSTNKGGTRDIYAVRTDGDTALRELAAGATDEYGPSLSPDGRWLAYVSQESGRPEVYVRPFPNTSDAKYQVSMLGGSEPLWAHSGRELFFIDAAGQFVVAQVSATPTFTVARQQILFSLSLYVRDLIHNMYAVAPDDRRFVMVQLGAVGSGDVVLVDNFFEVVKAKLRR